MAQLSYFTGDPRAALRTSSLLLADPGAASTAGAVLSSTAGAVDLSAVSANGEINVGTAVATDLRLNGATAGRDALWDASVNTFRLGDSALLSCGAGDDLSLYHDGTDSGVLSTTGDLLIRSSAAAGAIRLQTGTATAATAVFVQDSAASEILSATGAGVINVPLGRTLQHSSGFLVPCYSTGAHQSLSGPGAMNLTSSYTRWTTTGADAGTLAAPGVAVPPGFVKKIQMVADGGDGTLTVTGLAGAYDTWVFSEIGHSITVMAVDATTWTLVDDGVGDTTVGSMAAFS